jgi:vacuolar-type H+-ATPase subunit I/STV1
MTGHSDKYWDDLGVAWRAIEVDVDVVRPRLQSRLRRQSLLIRTALVLGVPLAACGLVLGALTVWWGWTTATWNFVARGVAIGIIAALALTGLFSLVSVRGSADARALAEMLALAVRRARATLAVIRVGLLSCAIAAVFGVIGAVIRTRAGRPPALSPVVDVALLVLVTVVLLVYRGRAKVTLAKLRYLAQAIASDASDGTERQ